MTTVKESPNGSKSPSFFRSVVSKLKPPVAPVSLVAQQHTSSPLKSQISDMQSRENVSRCEFTFSDGRQCRNRRASLCAHHSSKRDRKRGAKGINAPELEALCGDLTTATNINRALAQTFLLMAQGRISRKDAVAFGYLSQLLLQTVSGVRAEYVAANGYRQWENKLKTSLMPDADDDPEPSPGGDSGPSGGGGENLEQRRNGVAERQKGMSIRPLLPHKEGERGIPPKPLPVNKVHPERGIPPKPFPVNNSSVEERPLAERIMGKPDYADILSRSLDMLDRKYDFTPEGRSEAQKLALELELMKPAPAKPAKDFFGQTVALVRRFRDENDSQACSSAPVAAAVPEAQRSCAPSASDPTDFVAPPSRRHRKPHSHSSAPGCAHPNPQPRDPNRRPCLIRKLVAQGAAKRSPRRGDFAHLRRATRQIL
jgi:hypothetical protein